MNVVIKNDAGQFLSGFQGSPRFVDRLERAFVYDYEADKVEEQVRIVNERHGCNWSWQDVGNGDGLLCLPKTPYVSQESPVEHT